MDDLYKLKRTLKFALRLHHPKPLFTMCKTQHKIIKIAPFFFINIIQLHRALMHRDINIDCLHYVLEYHDDGKLNGPYCKDPKILTAYLLGLLNLEYQSVLVPLLRIEPHRCQLNSFQICQGVSVRVDFRQFAPMSKQFEK